MDKLCYGISLYFPVGFEHLWGELMFSFFCGTTIFIISSIPLLNKENLPNWNEKEENLCYSVSVSLNIKFTGKCSKMTDTLILNCPVLFVHIVAYKIKLKHKYHIYIYIYI